MAEALGIARVDTSANTTATTAAAATALADAAAAAAAAAVAAAAVAVAAAAAAAVAVKQHAQGRARVYLTHTRPRARRRPQVRMAQTHRRDEAHTLVIYVFISDLLFLNKSMYTETATRTQHDNWKREGTTEERVRCWGAGVVEGRRGVNGHLSRRARTQGRRWWACRRRARGRGGRTRSRSACRARPGTGRPQSRDGTCCT